MADFQDFSKELRAIHAISRSICAKISLDFLVPEASGPSASAPIRLARTGSSQKAKGLHWLLLFRNHARHSSDSKGNPSFWGMHTQS
jgi:hypothetical protein